MKPVLVMLAVLASVASASPTRAHAILVDSTPAIRAVLKPGRNTISLRFNSKVDPVRSRLTLVAGGTPTVLPIDPADAPDKLASHAELAAGSYTLRWQVLAVDGHITRGDVPFTVAP